MLVDISTTLSMHAEEVILVTGVSPDDVSVMARQLAAYRVSLGINDAQVCTPDPDKLRLEYATGKVNSVIGPKIKTVVLLKNGSVVGTDWEPGLVKASVNGAAYSRSKIIYYHDVREMSEARIDGEVEKVRKRMSAQGFHVDVIIPVRSKAGTPSVSRIETALM